MSEFGAGRFAGSEANPLVLRDRPEFIGPPRAPPTFAETITASFRHDNIVGAAIANQIDMDQGSVDPEFDLWAHVRERRTEAHLDTYIRNRAWTRQRAEMIDRQLNMEAENRRVLDSLPWYISLPLGVVSGGLLDPTVLMPGGALVRSGRGSYSVLQSARSVGAAAAGATALQEAVLQNLQVDRPWEESAMNIGGAAVLGAVLGGVGASVMPRHAIPNAHAVIDRETPNAPLVREEIMASTAAPTVPPVRAVEGAPPPVPSRAGETPDPVGQRVAPVITDLRRPRSDGTQRRMLELTPEERARSPLGNTDDLDDRFGLGRPFVETATEVQLHLANLPTSAFESGVALSSLRRLIEYAIDQGKAFTSQRMSAKTQRLIAELEDQFVVERNPRARRNEDGVLVAPEKEPVITISERRTGQPTLADRWDRAGLDRAEIDTILAHAQDAGYTSRDTVDYLDRYIRGALAGDERVMRELRGHLLEGRLPDGSPVRAELPQTPAHEINGEMVREPHVDPTPALEASTATANTSTTPGALGAQQVTALPIEALTIKGVMARVLAAPLAWLIPSLRGNFRYTSYARQVYQQLMESVAIQSGHAEGVLAARGGSADRHAKTTFASYLTTVRDSRAIYNEMVKEYKMTWEQFGEAIGWAASNGDVALNSNRYVTQAAELWRRQFWNPFLEEGKRLGLFAENVSITTAESYFPRHAIREAFVQNEGVWHSRNVPYWVDRLTTAYHKQLDNLTRRLEDFDQRISDLALDRDARSGLAQRLSEQIEQVRSQHGEFFEIETRVKELRGQIRAGGDRKGLSQQIIDLRNTPGYGDYEKYIRRSGGRVRRLLAVDPANKIERLHDRLLLEEDRVFNDIDRLVTAGRRAEQRLSQVDSADHAEAVGALRDQITTFTRQFEARQNKLRDDILKAEADLSRRTLDLRERKDELVRQLKEREQALGNPETRMQAVKDRAGMRAEVDQARLQLEEKQLKYEEQQLRRLRRDSERGAKEEEKFNRMTERLRRLEDLDPDQAQQAIRQALDELAQNRGDRLIERGRRIQRLIDQMNDLDPQWTVKEIERLSKARRETEDRFYERWRSGENIGTREPDFADLAREISKEAYEKYRGTAYGSESSARPDYIWTIEKGPMRDRTYNVPDFVLDPPGESVRFFNRNIFEVGNIHGRQMAGDIGIARVFGEPTMRDVLGQVAQDGQPAVRGKLRESYEVIETAVNRATSVEEMRAAVGVSPNIVERIKELVGRGSVEEVRARLLNALERDYKDAKSDIQVMRDTLRGTYQVAENSSAFGRIVRATSQINYMRVMGGQGISMVTDLYRPAMVRGLNAFMADGLEQLMGNMRGFRASQAELQQMHLVTNNFMNRTLLTFADIGDPMVKGTPLERFLEKTTQLGSIWNGSRMVQDFAEGIGGTITQTHILRIARDGAFAKNIEYLSSLGLTQDLVERIGRYFGEHGETFKHGRGEVLVANTNEWVSRVRQADGTVRVLPDLEAIHAFRNAVSKEVDSMFSSRMAGDVPFFMQTPLGRMLLQFNSFNMSSYSRVLIRGVQGEPARFLGALIPMTGLGMMVAWIQAAAGGQDRLERFNRNVEANPMFWIAEGLDKGGFFALPFMGANYIESAASAGGFGRVNPIKTPLMMAAGDVPRDLATGNTQRDIVSFIGGPTVGLVSAIPRGVGAVGAALRGDTVSKQQASAAQQMIPYGTYPGMRQVLQYLFGDFPGQR